MSSPRFSWSNRTVLSDLSAIPIPARCPSPDEQPATGNPRRRRDPSLELMVDCVDSTVELFYRRMFVRYGVPDGEYRSLLGSVGSPALLLRVLWWVLRAHTYLEWSLVKESAVHKADGMVDDQAMFAAHGQAISELERLLRRAEYHRVPVARALELFRREIAGVTCFPEIDTRSELLTLVYTARSLNNHLARAGEFWCKCEAHGEVQHGC